MTYVVLVFVLYSKPCHVTLKYCCCLFKRSEHELPYNIVKFVVGGSGGFALAAKPITESCQKSTTSLVVGGPTFGKLLTEFPLSTEAFNSWPSTSKCTLCSKNPQIIVETPISRLGPHGQFIGYQNVDQVGTDSAMTPVLVLSVAVGRSEQLWRISRHW